uniref:Uncharacterized protein n=1 Tax=Sarcophilus harrisii TaxID=9305 RepID=A0A7N4NV26_SARHA
WEARLGLWAGSWSGQHSEQHLCRGTNLGAGRGPPERQENHCPGPGPSPAPPDSGLRPLLLLPLTPALCLVRGSRVAAASHGRPCALFFTETSSRAASGQPGKARGSICRCDPRRAQARCTRGRLLPRLFCPPQVLVDPRGPGAVPGAGRSRSSRRAACQPPAEIRPVPLQGGRARAPGSAGSAVSARSLAPCLLGRTAVLFPELLPDPLSAPGKGVAARAPPHRRLCSHRARAPELPLELRPGEYRILLCVDVSETTGGSRRPDILRELQHLGVPHDVRKLHVGDFVWVAQETRPRDPSKAGESYTGGLHRGWGRGGGAAPGGVQQGGGGQSQPSSCPQPGLLSWSWTTWWRGSVWMTCVAASPTGASGSRRYGALGHEHPSTCPWVPSTLDLASGLLGLGSNPTLVGLGHGLSGRLPNPARPGGGARESSGGRSGG